MRRNDPGLTGGLPAGYGQSTRLGVRGIAVVLVGLAVGYLACLHGTDMGQKDLVAFAVWSIVAVIVAYLISVMFRYVLVLAVLAVGALWWVEHPLVDSAAAPARDLRNTLCGKITYDIPDVPVKEWVC